MRTNRFKAVRDQCIQERNEAFLSMDREKILAYSRKYNGDNGYAEADIEVFWISVHKARTAILGLPEEERRLSMEWLTERGYKHYASDLDEKDNNTRFVGCYIF